MSTVDTTCSSTDDKILECLCYLDDLCVSLISEQIKEGVKKTSSLIAQLEFFNENINRVAVCYVIIIFFIVVVFIIQIALL